MSYPHTHVRKLLVIFLITSFFIFFFIIGSIAAANQMSSYASLDLKVFDPDYVSGVEGKSVLSFRYLINETFQISLLIRTYNPEMPRVLIQYCPNTGVTGYRRGEFIRIPVDELEIDRDVPGLFELDMNQTTKLISDFAYVSRIGIRGIDCYIGDIRLTGNTARIVF